MATVSSGGASPFGRPGWRRCHLSPEEARRETKGRAPDAFDSGPARDRPAARRGFSGLSLTATVAIPSLRQAPRSFPLPALLGVSCAYPSGCFRDSTTVARRAFLSYFHQ